MAVDVAHSVSSFSRERDAEDGREDAVSSRAACVPTIGGISTSDVVHLPSPSHPSRPSLSWHYHTSPVATTAIITYGNLAIAGLVSLLAYFVVLVVYRLFFHPLRHFPGSKICAATLWYDFYYDVVKRGLLIWQIEKLHEQYGPIIRLSPNELHIQDSEFYDEIYTSAPRKRDKWDWWVNMASAPGSAFSTVDHELHRQRRSVMNPYFSKQRIVKIEPLIRSKVDKLAKRFSLAAQDASIVRLDVAFMALSTDVFSDYAFGYCDNYLDEPDFKLIWLETIHGGFESGSQSRQMPWLQPLVTGMPWWFLRKALPPVYFFLRWQDGVKVHVDRIMNDPSPRNEQKDRPKTMFHALRDCDLPASERTSARIVDEGAVVMGAASETVAHTLSITSYHLLSEPGQSMIGRLRDELTTIMPTAESTPTYPQLEQLPYLSAVIAEGIRMAWGVTSRLPRIATDEDLVYTDRSRGGKRWVIPRGTPVSSNGYFVLSDPMIFPDPHTFKPERWLITEGDGTVRRNVKLEKYLVSFGKGSRQCLGMNLAYAELFLTLPMLLWELFPRFELFETVRERDIDLKHDWFTSMPELGSPGIRVKGKG